MVAECSCLGVCVRALHRARVCVRIGPAVQPPASAACLDVPPPASPAPRPLRLRSRGATRPLLLSLYLPQLLPSRIDLAYKAIQIYRLASIYN